MDPTEPVGNTPKQEHHAHTPSCHPRRPGPRRGRVRWRVRQQGRLVGLGRGRGGQAAAVARRLLDTRGRLRPGHPAVPEDRGRRRRDLQDVLRRVGRPEPRRRGRPEGRRRHLLARARPRPPRQGRSRLRQRDGQVGLHLGRQLHRPQGQPEEHQDLGRPGQARDPGRHAQPVQLGRGQVEPDGRGRGEGVAVREHADHQARQGPAEVGPRGAADVHVRHGRRPDLLRERGDHRAEEGPERRLRHPRQDAEDREPDRGDGEGAAGGEGVRQLRALQARAAGLRQLGLPPGQPGGPGGQQGEVPDAVRPVHDREVRRLVEGQRRVLRSRQGLDRQDRGRGGSVDREVSVAAPALRTRPRGRLRAPAGALGLGITTLWLSLIVLLPLAALVARSLDGGLDAFWHAVTSRQALDALRFTLAVSLIVALVNAVFGTLIPWVLVRDDFRGKSIVNALLAPPFALPTIVAGLTLLALYGPTSPLGINVAFTKLAVGMVLLFVTLPVVVRAVQPVLLELDREMEESAASLGAAPAVIFTRVILPNLLPAILSGAGLAFARAVGEFGSVVLISGNIPFQTQVTSVFVYKQIQSDNPIGAAAVSVVLLAVSLGVLLLIRWGGRRAR